MSTDPYRLASLGIDLKDRIKVDTSVDASPAAAAETIIATTGALPALRADQSVLVLAFAAYTVGASGTAGRLRIRRTDGSGTVVADTDAVAQTAGAKVELVAVGFDALGAVGGQVYVATLTITAGAAASTVSNVALVAFAV